MEGDTSLSELLEKMQLDIEKHAGFKAHVLWSNHYRIYSGVYQPNRHFLIEHINAPSKDDRLSVEMMQNVRPPTIRESYINEFLRLLHNYLASEFTVVDHSRGLIKNYAGTEFEGQYKERLKSVNESPLHFVLQDLRAIFLHDSVPPIRWTVTLKTDGNNSFNLALNIPRLLEHDRLTSRTTNYLREQGEEMEMLKLLEQHGHLIDNFNDWLHQQFQRLHSKDIDAVNRLIAKRNAVLRGDGATTTESQQQISI